MKLHLSSKASLLHNVHILTFFILMRNCLLSFRSCVLCNMSHEPISLWLAVITLVIHLS